MLYDCFTFFNEFDLLEIRLHELDGAVDRFVLVEATKTFSGIAKEPLFEKHRKRYKRFLDRIVHVVVRDMDAAPDVRQQPYYLRAAAENRDLQALIDSNPSVWSREAHQRNCIMRGLQGCASDDVILLGDLDEIPNPLRFDSLRELAGVKVFRQRLYYYYLNCLAPDPWDGTKAIRFGDLTRTTPQEVRSGPAGAGVVDDGGWHFSYLGGLERIQTKLGAFSHQELNNKEVQDLRALGFNLENHLDLYGRPYAYQLVPIDASYPRYLQRHRFRYRRLIQREQHPDENTRWLREEILRLRRENEALKRRPR
jgi:beta-1,4-mannosyl-glycoprotein beta-1,4-N-acetylglucosaminyltransferase